MPISGLITFLGLTTAPATNTGVIGWFTILAGLVGAILGGFGGAWANSWYRNREAKKAEDRELEALMRLLSYEVERNGDVLNEFLMRLKDDPDDDPRADTAANLVTEVWHESRVRLAHLLPDPDHLRFLTYYYRNLESMRGGLEKPSEGSSAKGYVPKVEKGRRRSDVAFQIIGKYKDDPPMDF
jgi:hypothetical protein